MDKKEPSLSADSFNSDPALHTATSDSISGENFGKPVKPAVKVVKSSSPVLWLFFLLLLVGFGALSFLGYQEILHLQAQLNTVVSDNSAATLQVGDLKNALNNKSTDLTVSEKKLSKQITKLKSQVVALEKWKAKSQSDLELKNKVREKESGAVDEKIKELSKTVADVKVSVSGLSEVSQKVTTAMSELEKSKVDFKTALEKDKEEALKSVEGTIKASFEKHLASLNGQLKNIKTVEADLADSKVLLKLLEQSRAQTNESIDQLKTEIRLLKGGSVEPGL